MRTHLVANALFTAGLAFGALFSTTANAQMSFGGIAPKITLCAAPATLDACHLPINSPGGACANAAVVKSACTQLLQNDFKARAQASSSSKLVVFPTQLQDATGASTTPSHPGQLISVKQDAPVSSDASAPVVGVPGRSFTVTDAFRRKAALIAGSADPWDLDGNHVSTCGEYVYKRFYDYEHFKARTTGLDDEAVYALMNDPATAVFGQGSTRTLFQRTPSHQPIPGSLLTNSGVFNYKMSLLPGMVSPPLQVATYGAKNAFFSTSLAVLRAAPRYTTDATYKANVDNVLAPLFARTGTFASPPDPWQRATQMRNAQQALSSAEREDIDRRVGLFKRALAAYEQAVVGKVPKVLTGEIQDATADTAAPEPILTVTPIGSTGPITIGGGLSTTRLPIDGAIDDIYALLMAEVNHVSLTNPSVTDMGCVNPDSMSCDWSLSGFVDRVEGAYGAAKEKAYNACISMAGSDSLSSVPADKRADADTLDAYFAAVRSQLEPTRLLVQPYLMGTDTFGQSFGDSNKLGDDGSFSVDYAYNADWTVKVAERDANKKICRLDGDVTASIMANAHIFNNAIPLIDTKHAVTVSAGVGGVHSHLKLAGQNIYTPIDKSGPAAANVVNQVTQGPRIETPRASATFAVFMIPVTVQAYGAFSYGYDINVGAKGGNGCSSENVLFGLTSSISPWMHADALASIAVGVDGFQAGVRGDVELIRVEMPIGGGIGIGKTDATPTAPEMPALVINTTGAINENFLKGKLEIFAEALFLSASKEIFSWPGLAVPTPLWDASLVKLPLPALSQLSQPAASGSSKSTDTTTSPPTTRIPTAEAM